MKTTGIIRDERTTTVENASYRWAYLILSFGVLLSVALRGFLWNEAGWDLLGLVIVSSFMATFYQATHHILTRRVLLVALLTALVSGLVAAGIVFFLH